MVESSSRQERYGVVFRAREHEGRADTLKNGAGGNSGMRPHELLEAALASCMTITARMAAEDLGIAAGEITVEVELERGANASVFHCRVRLPPALSQAHVDAIGARVESSPVRRTLSAQLRFATSVGRTPDAEATR